MLGVDPKKQYKVLIVGSPAFGKHVFTTLAPRKNLSLVYLSSPYQVENESVKGENTIVISDNISRSYTTIDFMSDLNINKLADIQLVSEISDHFIEDKKLVYQQKPILKPSQGHQPTYFNRKIMRR